jgi:hypothetical protein
MSGAMRGTAPFAYPSLLFTAMAHDQHTTQAQGTDAKAAFMGLIIGAIVLFGIVRGIVWATNAKYVNEKAAATAEKK